MTEKANIPAPVLRAFPKLASATFVRQLASPVPLVPDTTFDIFTTETGRFLALVTTDYADPLAQGQELKRISGQYELIFDHLLKPYDNDQIIEVLTHEKMGDNFFISIENTYFYVAPLTEAK
jgi:hypothetical protein